MVTTGSAGDTTGPIINVGSIGTSSARIGALEFDSAFVVRLGGDIYATSATFAGPTGGALTHLSLLATISHDTGNLTINTAGPFTMDQSQKLSVFDQSFSGSGSSSTGNLTIISNNHPIQIGDLSALGQITVNAGSLTQTITVVARAPEQFLASDGSTGMDRGVDIVAGAQGRDGAEFHGDDRIAGSVGGAFDGAWCSLPRRWRAEQPEFLGQRAVSSSATTQGLRILTQNQSTNLTAADFEGSNFLSDGNVLDLAVLGMGNPVTSLSTVVTQVVEVVQPVQTQSISGAVKSELQEIGIFARDLRTDEVVDSLIGRAYYDDVPYKLDPSLGDNQVASDRLPFAPVIPTVEAYAGGCS